VGKSNCKDEKKKEEEKEKEVLLALLNLSLPEIVGNKDRAGESTSDILTLYLRRT